MFIRDSRQNVNCTLDNAMSGEVVLYDGQYCIVTDVFDKIVRLSDGEILPVDGTENVIRVNCELVIKD